ncbi:MAG TPA: DUF6190 family protein [archaeon]|nr:DUF6190 family protein [archaeon]
MKDFVDHSVFLGMHSKDEKTRIACKNFFVSRLKNKKKIWMSFEQVGKCDDMIWSLPRKKQDAYYPFMDNLHTVMKIDRIPYSKSDIDITLNKKDLEYIDFLQRLTVGMAISRKGVLYTTNQTLLSRKSPVTKPVLSSELYFPKNLEKLYQKSLELRV